MSTSFGTGSAVLLHMVLSSGYSIPIIHLHAPDREPVIAAANKEYANTLHAWFRGKGFNIEIFEYHASDKLQTLKWALQKHNACAVLQGIRADQSDFRRTRHHKEPVDDINRIYPLLHMTQTQMERYLKRYNLPRHPLGLPGKKITPECGLHL